MVDSYAGELEEERRMKDEFMARHRESPFVAESVVGFSGLHYFEVDPAFRVRARLERLDAPREAYLRTNRDGQAVMRYLGNLSFRLGGRGLALRLFHAGEGVGTSVFLPFRDATSGEETYGPGRYLTLELNPDDEYELDFNRAFNPYCAYTDAYECAFPPAENDLPIAVRAGEKVWSSDRNPRTPSSAVLDLLRRAPAAPSASGPQGKARTKGRSAKGRAAGSAERRTAAPRRRRAAAAGTRRTRSGRTGRRAPRG
ncbi:MAG TPA: DUF1684 domain-containing protein [Thermoplasmata archaeon]|nr:DUF1684 domain-containing protein [Thermoplasmata archaeon]